MKKLYTVKDFLKTDYKRRKEFTKYENIRIISELKPSALARWNDYQNKIRQKRQELGYFPEAHAYSTDSPLFALLNDNRPLSSLKNAELRQQVKTLYNFFKTKTSTFSGWLNTLNKFEKKFQREVDKKYNVHIELNKEDYERFWKVYKRVTEVINPSTLNSNYELWREIGEYVSQQDGEFNSEDWANYIINKIEEDTLQGKYNIEDSSNPYVYRGNKKL